jgi:23S rRNA pseudouridine955/2504/2580 synthase
MQSFRTAVQVVEVGAEENGRKLTTFLEARLGSLPAGLLMRLVRTGQVRIDGRRCKPFDRVATGQKVRIPPVNVERREGPEPAERPTQGDLDIVHEDADMIVVHKPAGLPVHAGTGWDDSVHDRLRGRFSSQAFTPVPVHRLDRDTSGLLLCARTHDFLRAMHAQWPAVTKAYLCWVEGCWPHEGWRTIVSDLAKVRTGEGEKVVSGQGRRAVSHVRPIQVSRERSLLLVVLGSGRTHQIRVHLADEGHPIVGDPKYGRGKGLRLHAAFLSWPGHAFFVLPSWPGEHRVSPSLAGSISDILSTAPVKEGAS